LLVAIVVVALTSLSGSSTKNTPAKSVSASTAAFSYQIESQIKLGADGKTVDIPIKVKNEQAIAATPWCVALADQGPKTGPIGIEGPLKAASISAHASIVVTVAVPLGAGLGTPSRAEAQCGVSKTAVDNAAAWVTAEFSLVAAWANAYSNHEFPIIQKDVAAVYKVGKAYKKGQSIKPVLDACVQLKTDAEFQVTYSARPNPPPPIPNVSLQAQMEQSLKELRTYTHTCTGLFRGFQQTGHFPTAPQLAAADDQLSLG
jgi:hypothetical protein